MRVGKHRVSIDFTIRPEREAAVPSKRAKSETPKRKPSSVPPCRAYLKEGFFDRGRACSEEASEGTHLANPVQVFSVDFGRAPIRAFPELGNFIEFFIVGLTKVIRVVAATLPEQSVNVG
jgi:hypothetical protein